MVNSLNMHVQQSNRVRGLTFGLRLYLRQYVKNFVFVMHTAKALARPYIGPVKQK